MLIPAAPPGDPEGDPRRVAFKGTAYILASALCHAVSSAFAKLLTDRNLLGSLEITFFRFFLGFLCFGAYMLVGKKGFRPRNTRMVTIRAVTNALSIMLFFLGIQYSTVTKANMLNMSYPLFVFALSPFLNKERIGIPFFLYLAASVAGIWLVVMPDFRAVNAGDLFALLSGLLGGLAAIALRDARKSDPSHLIVFYLMAAGTLINFCLIAPTFALPPRESLLLLALSFVTGLAGQSLITTGFRFVPAATGSLLSTSRMLFAVMLGVGLFGEPLSPRIIAGGLFILCSLVAVSGMLDARHKGKSPPETTGGASV